MAEGDDAHAVGLGDFRAFLHRVMGMFVYHNQIALRDQARQRAEIRQTDGRIDQHGFGAQPICQLCLGVLVAAHGCERA